MPMVRIGKMRVVMHQGCVAMTMRMWLGAGFTRAVVVLVVQVVRMQMLVLESIMHAITQAAECERCTCAFAISIRRASQCPELTI
jgi:hypothetical protein